MVKTVELRPYKIGKERFLNTLDIVLFFLILALGFKGFLHGFIREICGLAAIVGGIFIASRLGLSMGEMLGPILGMKSESSMHVLGFAATFAAVWIGITFVAAMLSKAVDLSGLGVVNKLLGFATAGGKVFLILSVIVYALSNVGMLRTKLAQYTDDSHAYPLMVASGSWIMKLNPEDLNTSTLDKLK